MLCLFSYASKLLGRVTNILQPVSNSSIAVVVVAEICGIAGEHRSGLVQDSYEFPTQVCNVKAECDNNEQRECGAGH